jgi:hypothetical protein
MQKRSSNKKQDINQLASSILEQTIKESEKDAGKNPNAVALGRLGGLKGGKARASKLTPEQRKEIAKKAAAKRWSKHITP